MFKHSKGPQLFLQKNAIIDVLLGSKDANEICFNEANLAAFSC